VRAQAGEDENDPDAESPRRLLDDAESASGVDVGILVHALLERLDVSGPRPAEADLQALAQDIVTAEGLVLASSALDRAVSLAGAFWESPVAGTFAVDDAVHEAQFFFVQNGVAVSGVMDLLVREDERWLVVDYKSNALGGRSPREVAEEYSLQATMYSLAALKAGAPAVRMEFLFLERPDEPVPFEHGREDLALLESRLEDALSGLRASDFHPRTGSACAACGMKNVCEAMNRGSLVVE
jgi:hypothetical protein